MTSSTVAPATEPGGRAPDRMMPESVVVGVDGSIPSYAAIRWAIGHAADVGCPVLLAHVKDDEWGLVGSRLIDEVNAGSAAILADAARYASGVDPSVPVSTVDLAGSPMWALAQRSDETTLLVVGTHKSSFHYGRAYGSRSLQLATLASGAVAVVPESAVRIRHGVVAGVDHTAAGVAALDFAADYAASRDAELLLVRAAPAGALTEAEADRADSIRVGRDAQARAELAFAVDRVRARQPQIAIRSRLVHRAPGICLNDLAQSARLLVIGDSRRADTAPSALGSVAYDVLMNVSSPTVVVHAPVAAIASEQKDR